MPPNPTPVRGRTKVTCSLTQISPLLQQGPPGLYAAVTMVTSGRGAWTLSPCLVLALLVCRSEQTEVKPAGCSSEEHPIASYQGELHATKPRPRLRQTTTRPHKRVFGCMITVPKVDSRSKVSLQILMHTDP